MKVSVAHTTGSSRVIVVPGRAVHVYAESPVRHLRDNGYDARLLSQRAWRGIDHDLERYGRNLAADIDLEVTQVDVLIGLSAGTQAAAVAASSTDYLAQAKPYRDGAAAHFDGLDPQRFPLTLARWTGTVGYLITAPGQASMEPITCR